LGVKANFKSAFVKELFLKKTSSKTNMKNNLLQYEKKYRFAMAKTEKGKKKAEN